MESAAFDDALEVDLRPAASSAACTGGPNELIEGADGGAIDAGTDARYSAPCTLTLPPLLLFLAWVSVGERSLLDSSSVLVRCRALPAASLSAIEAT
jgi:hypothetical protein